MTEKIYIVWEVAPNSNEQVSELFTTEKSAESYLAEKMNSPLSEQGYTWYISSHYIHTYHS
jgi:hypothetical protein